MPIAGEPGWGKVIDQVRDHGAALIPHSDTGSISPLAPATVQFLHGNQEIVQVTGQVIQILQDQFALAFVGEEKERLMAAVCPAEPKGKKEADEGDKPLWHRYSEMTKPEKMRLARRGNADARRLVLKDRDPTLQLHLLGNPGITAREIAGLIRSGSASHEFLRRVISRADLTGNAAVVEAIVRNPHTPIKLAVQLVPKLQKEVVRRIAKSGNLRGAIVSAARKRVIRR